MTDASGQTVVVTAGDQVNLSSTGLYIGLSDQQQAGDDDQAADVSDASQELPLESSTANEKYVTFALVGSLLETSKSEALAGIFRTLYGILDEHAALYAQGTLQLALDASSAEQLVEQLKSAGVKVTVRDQ